MAERKRVESFEAEHLYEIGGALLTVVTWTGSAREWRGRGEGLAQGWGVMRRGDRVFATKVITGAGGGPSVPRYAAEGLVPSLN